MNFEDEDHKDGQEVTGWKVLSPNAIQVRYFMLVVSISMMVHQNNIPKLQFLIKY